MAYETLKGGGFTLTELSCNFDVFDDEEKEASNINCSNGKVGDCKCVQRMVQAMKYFHSINHYENDGKLMQFYNETYTSLLNDYVHISKEHNSCSDLNEIAKLIDLCLFVHCPYSLRYRRDRENDKYLIALNANPKLDFEYLFVREKFDAMHYLFFHSAESARIKLEEKTLFSSTLFSPTSESVLKSPSIARKQSEKTLFSPTPRNGLRSASTIRETLSNIYTPRSVSALSAVSLPGIPRKRSNRFFIPTDEGEETLLDCIHQSIASKEFEAFLTEHQFDSDAIGEDISNNSEISESNVIRKLANDKDCAAVRDLVHVSKMHDKHLQTGFTFFYWDYYKNKHEDYDHSGWLLHKNDYNGHSEQQLYISLKYKDLGTELLQNRIFCLTKEEFQCSLTKANKYMESDIAKKMESQDHEQASLHYGIKDETSISKEHLLAVILYTDWSELSTKFSATFRKKSAYEKLESMKARNAEFANWAKLLREAVQLFGSKGFEGNPNDSFDVAWNQKNNRQIGPFYCGLSVVLNMPEVNIKLCGPTSTSTSKKAAEQFANDDGMLLTLDYGYDFYNHDDVRSFGCVGFSNFVHESECLFMGGQHTMRIVNILHRQNMESFSKYLEPLYYFDSILKGQLFKSYDGNQIDPKLVDDYYKLLEKLIQHKLNRKAFTQDMYINNTFECMTNNKTEIIINLESMTKKQDELDEDVELEMLYPFKSLLLTEDNIIKPLIFDLFPNCRNVIIYATNTWGNIDYKFDLFELKKMLITKAADCMKMRKIQITIVGQWDYIGEVDENDSHNEDDDEKEDQQKHSGSWIRGEFESCKGKLQNDGLTVNLEQKRQYFCNDHRKWEDHLIITMN